MDPAGSPVESLLASGLGGVGVGATSLGDLALAGGATMEAVAPLPDVVGTEEGSVTVTPVEVDVASVVADVPSMAVDEPSVEADVASEEVDVPSVAVDVASAVVDAPSVEADVASVEAGMATVEAEAEAVPMVVDAGRFRHNSKLSRPTAFAVGRSVDRHRLDFSRAWPSPTFPARMVPVPRAKLCVTEGALEELNGSRLSVNVPKMRAFVAAATPQAVEAQLTYMGHTSDEANLGPGAMREQFGLKLRAHDACNLVYAMWRIESESEFVVSVKSIPGMHTSSECGNHGYRNIRPKRGSAVPRLSPGSSHALFVEMTGSEMRVSVDGREVWEGDLGPDALSFDGPVGVRTDNGRFEFQLLVREMGAPVDCRAGDHRDE